jgi:hypothetical protein
LVHHGIRLMENVNEDDDEGGRACSPSVSYNVIEGVNEANYDDRIFGRIFCEGFSICSPKSVMNCR